MDVIELDNFIKLNKFLNVTAKKASTCLQNRVT